jgi:(2Fe-2S) ferredoxin
MSDTPYYQYHVFFCLNERQGQACCAQHQATQAFEHCKKSVKTLGLSGVGGVRVNKAGCLDRCAGAPVMVIYPQGTWYTFWDLEDIDEIVNTHLKNHQVVERLLLPQSVGR